MANKEYYQLWLKLKEQMNIAFAEDERLQYLAVKEIGVKPQGTAVEVVSRVYGKFCDIYNKLCECYDQMEQVQKRAYIKKIIDAITCRLLELKYMLEEVEVFEFTYPDNGLQSMLMIPQNIEILCPFFYPFETRQHEMQYIVDQIFAGNRIGDPSPTPSQIERREEKRLEEERLRQEEKEAEIKRKLAMGEEIVLSEPSVVMTPEELEEMKKLEEYNRQINTIQRMERSRVVIKQKIYKMNKEKNLYLELTGRKAPPAREDLRIRAAKIIQFAYRRFMEQKRANLREVKLRIKLGMIMPSYRPPSSKIQLEKVKEERRKFRRRYYEKFLEESMKENSRIFRLRKDNVMDDITDEINQYLREWYKEVKAFDEFPYPEEGGSILIVRGDTMTIEEYIEWSLAEEKRRKAEAGAPKTKEQKIAEQRYAEEERKRIEMEARDKEKKRILDYKKSRFNPDSDPGIYLHKGKNLEKLQDAWFLYKNQWNSLETKHAPIDVIRGYIKELITENAYKDVQLEVRPIVDEIMRLELKRLNAALRKDFAAGGAKPPLVQKRARPKTIMPPKPEKYTPAAMFQELVDKGIIKKYPPATLDDFWGDRNYAAADMRAILWTPSFPQPCLGDVKDLVRTRCILTLGCSCPNAVRTQLFVGPKGSGKRSLIYAVATETNSILIDLSPRNVYNKYPGRRIKRMYQFVAKISKLMQPTVIMVQDADKLFYKKVPKEEKRFNPTRLKRDFYREVIKPISFDDKIMVLGTATEPWLSKRSTMYRAFPSQILFPRSDYGSISFILTKMLMEFHGVSRDFNVHSLAQSLRGHDICSIIKVVKSVMTAERVAQLYNKPLKPMEILNAMIDCEECVCTDEEDYEMYKKWYLSYSPWGQKYLEYMQMLDSQLLYKLKKDKKEKGEND